MSESTNLCYAVIEETGRRLRCYPGLPLVQMGGYELRPRPFNDLTWEPFRLGNEVRVTAVVFRLQNPLPVNDWRLYHRLKTPEKENPFPLYRALLDLGYETLNSFDFRSEGDNRNEMRAYEYWMESRWALSPCVNLSLGQQKERAK